MKVRICGKKKMQVQKCLKNKTLNSMTLLKAITKQIICKLVFIPSDYPQAVLQMAIYKKKFFFGLFFYLNTRNIHFTSSLQNPLTCLLWQL